MIIQQETDCGALHLLVMVTTKKPLSELQQSWMYFTGTVNAKVPTHKKDSYMEYPKSQTPSQN